MIFVITVFEFKVLNPPVSISGTLLIVAVLERIPFELHNPKFTSMSKVATEFGCTSSMVNVAVLPLILLFAILNPFKE